MKINEEEIEKLMDDVKLIKSVFNKNRPFLQQIMKAENYRGIGIFSSVSVIVFSLIMYYLMHRYTSHEQIPLNIKIFFYISLFIDYILLGILKWRSVLNSAKVLNSKYSIGEVIKEIFSFQVSNIYLPMLLIILFIIIFFSTNGLAYFIVPAVSICCGLTFILLGGMCRITVFIVTGYWLIFSGFFVIFFSTIIHVCIALIITLGVGFCLLWLLSYIPYWKMD